LALGKLDNLWPTHHTCPQDNIAALQAYFEQLNGFETLDIHPNGTISITIDGETYQGRLNKPVQPGTPPADGQLQLTVIDDRNGDGTNDLEITYPNGDRQILSYLGATPEPLLALGEDFIVPPIDPTVASIPALVTQFLYTGDNPIQTGVAEGTIELERAATLRGFITTRDEEPLPNVTITILNHPEYGQTITTRDGYFNMAVNGGGQLTVQYQKDGFLPVQRQITTSWQQYAVVEDIVMIQLDPMVTPIDLTANLPMQVAQGSEVTDSDGTRRATILFPQGTTATMTLPDGSTQPLTQLDVRATEYTIGENGPKAMPAVLPPQSAYTYAVELSVDQALAADATRVDFSQPLPLYVDNFLNFPVGSIVPVGWYDRTNGAWIPSDNGRVLQILGIDNGYAILDVDGSGQAANAEALTELGISEAERQQLATRYTAGNSFWRSPITHFTPWDLNWPYGLPFDAEKPSPDEPKTKDDDNLDEPCEQAGCIIEAENQVLGERLAVTGTPFTLNYRSNRVPGRKAPYTLEIPLRGISVPGSLKYITLIITIAGQKFQYHLSAGTSSTTFIWDGKDAFGRRVQGRQLAQVHIGYVYEAVYYKNSFDLEQSFARAGVAPMRIPTRQEVTLWKTYTKQLGAWSEIGTGLGSLSLNILHSYDPTHRVLYLGNGKQRTRVNKLTQTLGSEADRVQFSGDGGPALNANIALYSDSSAIAFGPDGSLYIADSDNYRIRKVRPDGIITTIAGNGNSGFSGDGGLATFAQLSYPTDLAFGPDGSLYFVDSNRIRRIGPDNIITTVAGNGLSLNNYYYDYLDNNGLLFYEWVLEEDYDWSIFVDIGEPLVGGIGDGDKAINAIVSNVTGIAVDSQGDLYLAQTKEFCQVGAWVVLYEYEDYFWESKESVWSDCGDNRVRRVGPDGLITTVAGGLTDEEGSTDDNVPALESYLNWPKHLAVGPAGHLYIAEATRIRRIAADGIITTVAGRQTLGFSGDGGPATAASLNRPMDIEFSAEGRLYFTDNGNNRIRQIGLDGIITTVAGNGIEGFSEDGTSATMAHFSKLSTIAFGPSDQLYLTDGVVVNKYGYASGKKFIRRVEQDNTITTVVGKGTTTSPFPTLPPSSIIVSEKEGRLLYEFTPSGRHLHTIDSITGQVIYTFIYNENGYLVEIEDLDGDITRIERDDSDTPLAIVASDGQRTTLTLDDNGYLNSVTNPAGEVYQMHYTTDGLLTELIDPRSHKSVYQYDELGLFLEDTDAAGGGWTVARTDHPEGGYTTTMTSKEGRASSFNVEPQTNGDLWRTNTLPNGLTIKTVKKTDGGTTVTQEEGTVIVSQKGPDPRFGMQAPVTKRMTITTPGGLSGTVTTDKTVELANANDPLSLLKLTAKVTTNGRTSQSVYEAVNKTLTTLSAAVRQRVSYLNDKGRVVQETVPGLAEVYYIYDNRGRLTTVIEGQDEDARTLTISYDSATGYVAQITDALQRTIQFSRDAVGRVLVQTLPDSREIRYRYDANSNVASITPPSRPAHDFDYTEVDLQQQYTPPLLSDVSEPQTQYAYNLDKQLVQIRRPDEVVIELVYDETKGRLNRIDLPTGESVYYTYSDNTGQLETIQAADGTLSYTYDGPLLLSETWGSGAISGTLTRAYDNSFRLTTTSVNGNYTVNYQYDDDSLLTQVGDLVLNREAQNGFLTGTLLGLVTTQRTVNPFGELESEEAAFQGETRYQVEYSRDPLGRLVQKAETLEGETTTYQYRYNLAGQLAEVLREGVTVSRYEYDSNGNRLAVNGVIIGHYDNQDRLLQHGENQYTYTENGELSTKTNTVTDETTSYTYDVFTNLTRVQLPDGTEIEYLIDGRDRRIGKQVNGQLVQGFLYQGSLNPVAELDGNGNIVTRFVYGGRGNVPAYLVKNGQTFRVIADLLGSPRLIVNTTSGQIVQRLDYDEFGQVVLDTNLGFQPFGFAGGLYDPDTGLVRFGARDYDPEVGRWTAKDPIDFDGGDANLYGYIWNDPINFADPSGLACGTGVCVGIGIGVARGIKTGYDAYRAYRTTRYAAQAAQALANEIGDDDAGEAGEEAGEEGGECPIPKNKTKNMPNPKRRKRQHDPQGSIDQEDGITKARDRLSVGENEEGLRTGKEPIRSRNKSKQRMKNDTKWLDPNNLEGFDYFGY